MKASDFLTIIDKELERLRVFRQNPNRHHGLALGGRPARYGGCNPFIDSEIEGAQYVLRKLKRKIRE